MIRKAEYTAWIDSYLINELSSDEKLELEAELKVNAALLEEFNLQRELQEALSEKDVMNLKESLNKILNSSETQNEIKASFDLVEDLEEFNEFENKVDPDELLNYYESLPKLHIYQHEIASKENVHHFYKEQELTKAITEEEYSISDEALMAEIENAVMEKDVLQLRDNLIQIDQSMPEHGFNHEQISEFLENSMSEDEMIEFRKELELNSRLVADLKLHNDIDEAISEIDIINLRAEMNNIMESQTSYSQEFEDIEQYLQNELTTDRVSEFENEMFENSDLKADVNLHKDVDLAASEADIMDLRANLRGLSNNVEVSEEKSVVKLNSGWRSMAVRYSAAAVILVAFGFSIMLKLQTVNNDELYNQYLMESPSYGTSRSANVDLTFKYGRELLNDKNYEQALILFQQVLNEDISNSAAHFYMGSSLQNLEEFSKAISEYKVVVSNNENTLVDLAEFNLGLCYLMQEDRKQAVGQFKRIANAGGFYQPQAKAILKELRSISKK